MKKTILILFLLIVNSFASSKESLMNDIKLLIQKEEYLAIALNKYILQTGELPKKNGKVDISLLKEKKYLDSNFDIKSPFLNSDIEINFDTTSNSAYIVSLIGSENNYKEDQKYLYDFYTNNSFRVNTLAPNLSDETTKKTNLAKGTQIIYNDIQKNIVKSINNKEEIILENKNCTPDKYFYKLVDEKLTYKYCKKNPNDSTNNIQIQVYQKSPIILDENLIASDLKYIKADIGDKAFVKESTGWFEYYFHGDIGGDTTWSKVKTTNASSQQTTDEELAKKIASYIPNAKDFYIRQSIGCYLANGDIYCWGKNSLNQSGIMAGQMDTTLKPDYVNTPVMLKTQIDNPVDNTVTYDIKSKNWYNSPHRVKFDKIGVNSTNVCGITKIFNYSASGTNYKFGGDLYCNGSISSNDYEDMTTGVNQTPVLKRNKNIYTNKSTKIQNKNAKYLIDIAMVDDAIAILDDSGKIYTIGKNYKGSLGIDKTDYFYYISTPSQVVADSTIIFKKIFALRDSRTFGALDSNNQFYIWGERGTSMITKPTLISNTKFNPDAIFVNTNEFILKGLNDGIFYKTKNSTVEAVPTTIISGNPTSISYYKDNTGKEYWLYINENQELKGTDSLLTCKKQDGTTCNTTTESPLFNNSLKELQTSSNEYRSNYSKFTNVSIYKLDHTIKEISEDFEDQRPQDKWSKYILAYGNKDVGGFLGMFTGFSYYSLLPDKYDGTTRSFGVIGTPGERVIISFDFYEIGSWSEYNNPYGELFKVYVNGKEIWNTQYFTDTYYLFVNKESDGGEKIEINSAIKNGSYLDWYDSEKHTISFTDFLDANGKLELKFSSTLNESVLNESWGIDNLKVVRASNQEVISFEDFNSIVDNGWERNIVTYGGKDIGNFLGMFTGYYPYTKYTNPKYSLYGPAGDYDGTAKNYDFGTSNANQNVTVSFDFYEIDSWNADTFKVYSNGTEVFSKAYYTDSYYLTDYDGGTKVEIQGSSPEGSYYNWYHDEKHFISFNTKLDSNGKIKLEFFANFDSYLLKESWAMDNLIIKKDSTGEILAFENFEGEYSWSNSSFTTVADNGDKTQVPATTFLGYFPTSKSNGDPFFITKTYSFPGYGNYDVDIEFDFYEIDTWDGERFEFYANNELLAQDWFVQSALAGFPDSNITGVDLQDNIGNTSRKEAVYNGDQKYTYKLRSKLDANGNVTLKFQTNLEFNRKTYDGWGTRPEGIDNESWGIDNVKVKLKETDKTFVCAMTGVEQSSQMYCWGNVARSLPILNTSLYDSDKISTLNNLFFSQSKDINKQISFDAYDQDKNGMLFLKYPTYISGFDYPFYFK